MIYIVGVGRSGTSLVQSMFAAHPSFAFGPETGFLRRYVSTGRLTNLIRSHDQKWISEQLSGDEFLQRVGIDTDLLLRRTLQESSFSDGVFYRALLAAICKRDGRPEFGDKDPRSVEYLGLLRRVKPDAHVIHVIRDPRDVLASKKKALWSRGGSVVRHVFANRVQITLGCSQGPKLFGIRYHELLYERLLMDPDGTLRKLCARIGVEFDPAMLKYYHRAKRLISGKELSWKKETLGPLLKNNTGKWQQELSKWEVALCELSCRKTFTTFAYQRSGALRSLPLCSRLWVCLIGTVVALFDPIYRAYRCWAVWRAKKFA